jgi:ribosomal protein S18 acetylase RimI-like enzyme
VIDVVRVSPEDWELWRALRRAALAEAPDAFGSTLADWSGAGDSEHRWRDRLTSVPLNLVLTVDGDPVGMVSATGPGSDCAIELISLWVRPDARGQGVADEAVRQVIGWADAEHADCHLFLSVRTGNEPARRLYERHGFVDAGPSPDDPSERLMRRS